MPTLKKVPPSEVASWTAEPKGNGERKAIEQAFDSLIADLVPFEWAEVSLEDGDTKVNTRNRLKSAAERRGLNMKFRRTRDDRLIFQLVTKNEPDDDAELDKLRVGDGVPVEEEVPF